MGFTTVYGSNHHKFLDRIEILKIWANLGHLFRWDKTLKSRTVFPHREQLVNIYLSIYLSIDISELPQKSVIASSEVSVNKMRRSGFLPGQMRSISPFYLASSQCLHISISFILCSTCKHHFTFMIFAIIYLRSQLLCLMHFEYGCRKTGQESCPSFGACRESH